MASTRVRPWTDKDRILVISSAVTSEFGAWSASDQAYMRFWEWITEDTTSDELAVLDEALDVIESVSDDARTVREKAVIGKFLAFAQTKRFGTAAHSLLAIRDAYCSDWSVQNNPSLQDAEQFLSGGIPLKRAGFNPENDEEWAQIVGRTVRFCYELKVRGLPKNGLPTKDFSSTMIGAEGSLLVRSQEIIRNDLGQFVEQYKDRLTELIEVAVQHQTSDPVKLSALMDHSGHPALMNGHL